MGVTEESKKEPKTKLRLEDTVLVSVMDPTIFRRLEAVCRDALTLSQNHPLMHKSISWLYLVLRDIAMERTGHETADVVALRHLLKRTSETEGRQGTPNPLAVLYENRVIDEDQLRAGNLIVQVWRAFGRYLSVSGRSYDGQPGGKRSRPPDPASALGRSIEFDWRNYYAPWYVHAREKKVPCRAESYGVQHAATIVLHVVINDLMPNRVDEVLRLSKGTAVRVLREELGDLAGRMEGNAGERTEQKPT